MGRDEIPRRVLEALWRPLDVLIDNLAPDGLDYAREHMGDVVDKAILAFSLVVLVADTLAGRTSMPLVFIVALWSLTCCALGDRVRQRYGPPEAGDERMEGETDDDAGQG